MAHKWPYQAVSAHPSIRAIVTYFWESSLQIGGGSRWQSGGVGGWRWFFGRGHSALKKPRGGRGEIQRKSNLTKDKVRSSRHRKDSVQPGSIKHWRSRTLSVYFSFKKKTKSPLTLAGICSSAGKWLKYATVARFPDLTYVRVQERGFKSRAAAEGVTSSCTRHHCASGGRGCEERRFEVGGGIDAPCFWLQLSRRSCWPCTNRVSSLDKRERTFQKQRTAARYAFDIY